MAKTILGIAMAEMIHLQKLEDLCVHIRRIEEESVNAVLERIIKDEEYHIMLLQALKKDIVPNTY